MAYTALERRFAEFVRGRTPFHADDVTEDGHVSLDGTHEPNAKQNGIGSMFNQAARRGLIVFTGEIVRSRAPHRKGGAIRVWRGTEAGSLWARNVLEEQP